MFEISQTLTLYDSVQAVLLGARISANLPYIPSSSCREIVIDHMLDFYAQSIFQFSLGDELKVIMTWHVIF